MASLKKWENANAYVSPWNDTLIRHMKMNRIITGLHKEEYEELKGEWILNTETNIDNKDYITKDTKKIPDEKVWKLAEKNFKGEIEWVHIYAKKAVCTPSNDKDNNQFLKHISDWCKNWYVASRVCMKKNEESEEMIFAILFQKKPLKN